MTTYRTTFHTQALQRGTLYCQVQRQHITMASPSPSPPISYLFYFLIPFLFLFIYLSI